MSSVAQGEVGAPDWYLRWQRQMNRPLRVLHLGNIANNAFNNARIQRLYGIDSYVIASENYHIMSSPEWEEARFKGDYGDPFFRTGQRSIWPDMCARIGLLQDRWIVLRSDPLPGR